MESYVQGILGEILANGVMIRRFSVFVIRRCSVYFYFIRDEIGEKF